MWSIDRPPQWVGRGQELAIVRAGVEALSRGEGAVVWVEGEPGIGKSSLVAEAVAAGSVPGWDIGWGAAGKLTERLPLRVMLDCLRVRPGSPDPRRAHTADLLRSLRQGLFADGDASLTGIEMLVGLVDELCAAAPAIIVLDDLQWADDASLIVWHQLAASIGQLRLLLIGTCRPAPRRAEVRELRAAVIRHGGTVVKLGPLPETDVTALVTVMLGSPPGDALRQLTAQAAGNPLYVRELVDAMVREHALEIGPAAAEVSAAGERLPASLATVLTDRLSSVSADTEQMLRIAALLGGRFAVTDLAVVLRRPASELAAGVQEAVAAGILIGSDPDLAFRHLLIQQALEESMPAALRTALHAEAARELARLDRAVARKVTIISAPAGSGKTSLLHAWADRPDRAHRLAVVHVRRDQYDAQLFWLDLLNAVRQACGTAPGEPPAVTPDFNGRAMVDTVLAELAEHRGRVILVVDDAHELASTEALAQLTRLLANLPSQAHAIVSARRDLWLGLHQLRLADELAEIRAADLRFTERETRELLEVSRITLSEAGTALLHQRTEGWAAGLRLATLSLAGHPDPERFVAEFSGTDRTVAEYLLAEMLDRQPGEVQDLLLRASLLDRVNGELADLLTGRPGSERILLDLEDANAFVVSLDPGRTWFRFHQMFGDLLRLELRRTLPEELPALHRRAAGWFARHGQVADAIRHTQAAGDWPDAARLLADHLFSLTLDGQTRTIEVLVQAFPPGVRADPELALVRAGGDMLQGRLDEAAAHLAIAKSHAETTPPDRQRRLRVAIAALELSLARRRGHLADVVEQAAFLACPVTGQSDEELGDQRAAHQAAERALALAEADRLVLPFAMTGSRELLESLPRHQTAHASLLTDILDLVYGSSAAAHDRHPSPQARELSPVELRVLRYLPTNLSRPQIATELSVSVNTVSTHIRSIYAKLGAEDRSAAVHLARELRLLTAVRALALPGRL